jgi:hypothetical protein
VVQRTAMMHWTCGQRLQEIGNLNIINRYNWLPIGNKNWSILRENLVNHWKSQLNIHQANQMAFGVFILCADVRSLAFSWGMCNDLKWKVNLYIYIKYILIKSTFICYRYIANYMSVKWKLEWSSDRLQNTNKNKC